MAVSLLRRRVEPVPTVVFDTYWAFAARRQEIFFSRLAGASPPWTDDAILGEYRFTNAYRVLDRVSQYLLAEVVPTGSAAAEEVFFRAVLFKLFNRIDTWELLCRELGAVPSWKEFDLTTMDASLAGALARGESIYSAAYIMPVASRSPAGHKHTTHLRLVQWMMTDRLADRVIGARSMAEAFWILRDVRSIGDFLAYQLLTDLNYTHLCDFDEMEFVMPGPGARDGIAKCFSSLGDYSEAEVIRWAAESQHEHFSARGLAFRDLWGRPLQLIDCQNLFCEVDKYARVAHPDVAGRSGRTRIKRHFRPSGALPDPVLPAKWGIDPRRPSSSTAGSTPSPIAR